MIEKADAHDRKREFQAQIVLILLQYLHPFHSSDTGIPVQPREKIRITALDTRMNDMAGLVDNYIRVNSFQRPEIIS
ncbi:MAG: hypothetical protein MZV63_32740 [Marinilabiliales bacterium]|nr:hypothetical protein [Marinilabiliales bacterium]